jgi:phage terminase small subunit
MALEDVRKLGAELGLDPKLVEEAMRDFREEEVVRFFT